MRHSLKGIAGITASLTVVSPAVWIAMTAGDDSQATVRTAGAAAAADPANCPKPFPLDQVTEGMTGWGLTVSKGTTPEKFTVRIQGVLTDGIAPGVDMILAEADSPALDKAGAIWAGMSGSPVYAEDGRLLGAVGYGFSGTSKLAGITPAQAMLDIWSKPDTAVQARKGGIKLTTALRKKVTAKGLVSASDAADGLSTLPVPNLVSGLSKRRISTINKELAKSGSPVRVRQATSASGAPAPAGDLVAGGNFGVLTSYGTVTQGGIGTTTVVCDGRALAFGHPFSRNPAGPVRLTAVSGTALAVVPDQVFGAYKLANFGGVVGTLTQDRPTGVSARLGEGPAVTPIVADSTAGGATRKDTSYVPRPEDVPVTAAYHLWSSLDRARDEVTGGTTTTTWKVRGTSDGKPFELTVANRYSDIEDASGSAGVDIAQQLAALQQNPYTTVRFTGLQVTAAANAKYTEYEAAKLLVKSGKRWVVHNPKRPLKVTAGKDLVVKVRLTGYRMPDKDVQVSLRVPKKPKGTTGSLSIIGGLSNGHRVGCEPMNPIGCAQELRMQTKGFADLLAKLQATPRNDVLFGDLALGGRPVKHVKVQRQLDGVVSGGLDVGIVIG